MPGCYGSVILGYSSAVYRVGFRMTSHCVDANDESDSDVVIIKLGGSSITHKASKETLNVEALVWISKTLSSAVHESYLAPRTSLSVDEDGVTCTGKGNSNRRRRPAFIIVHGAGSFGHHTAREYGLKGQADPPRMVDPEADRKNDADHAAIERRHKMAGLAQTRLSVQKLNREVVAYLVAHGVNAVGVSPFSIPNLQAHGGNENGGISSLVSVVTDSLRAGLIPVIHGDACLYGHRGSMGAGILGGDKLVEAIGTDPSLLISQAIFITDVEGVYTCDPNVNSDAKLLKTIEIDHNGNIITEVTASGSTHEHDVTGGLETKLGAAATVAKSGTDVIIAKYMSLSAEQAVFGESEMEKGTVVRLAV